MKVLDFESIRGYDYMANSLAYLALGNMEEAVISAYKHLGDASGDRARLDIFLYIAKIYTKMGEFCLSANLLFRALRMRVEEGRVYAMLAFNFYQEEDMELARLYYAMAKDWSDTNGGILTLDGEYAIDISRRVKKPTIVANKMVESAYDVAIGGDFSRARSMLGSVSDEDMGKIELLLAMDIVEKQEGSAVRELLDKLFSTKKMPRNVMRLIYFLDTKGDYEAILKLTDRLLGDYPPTSTIRYMHAVALYNTGDRLKALEELNRYSTIYAYANPKFEVMRHFLQKSSNIVVRLYYDDIRDDTISILRDSEVCRVVLGNGSTSWQNDMTMVSMIRSMYIDGNITDAIRYVTPCLVSSSEGQEILQDILLDNSVGSAKMRVYIARNLLEYTSHLSAVYEGVYSECELVIGENKSKLEIDDIKDKCAFNLISGIE